MADPSENAAALLDRLVKAAVRQRGWTETYSRWNAMLWLRRELGLKPNQDPFSPKHAPRTENLLKAHFDRSAQRVKPAKDDFIDQCWRDMQEIEARLSPGQRIKAAVDNGDLFNVG